MANEAVNPIELYGNNKGRVKRYSCLDTDTIAKGQLMLMDTGSGKIGFVSGSTTTHVTGAYPVAGIASSEKVANDGHTTIGVWTLGKFDLKLNTDTCQIGDKVTISGANMIGPVYTSHPDAAATLVQNVLGTVLETGATTATVAVMVDC